MLMAATKWYLKFIPNGYNQVKYCDPAQILVGSSIKTTNGVYNWEITDVEYCEFCAICPKRDEGSLTPRQWGRPQTFRHRRCQVGSTPPKS